MSPKLSAINIRIDFFYITLCLILTLGMIHGCSDPDPDPNPCASVTCQNRGTCDDGTCNCPDGFSGTNCEVADPCIGVSCENGGTCVDGICDCPDGFSGANCETNDNPNNLNLQTDFGSLSTLEVRTKDIFAIWWDPKFDHEDDLELMFERLIAIRRDCKINLNMNDPPNPAAGYFYNVYIHHGANDLFPSGWGNGQGTDGFGLPFLTLPNGTHLDFNNTLHEGFHIFQYSSDSPGFTYEGDSQWYIETTAQWYKTTKNPGDDNLFIESTAKAENPQLALWHSFSNAAPGDPIDWLYEVQQYGLQSYLYFLSEVKGVDDAIFSEGFYNNIAMLPQEYHFEKIGGDVLRAYYADWAAQNTGGFDYLTTAQVNKALQQSSYFADINPQYIHPYALELTDSGTDASFSPEAVYQPRGWGYNVIKINNSEDATYTINLKGDKTGSEGGRAHFEARVVIKSGNRNRYESVEMNDAFEGAIEVSVTSSDSEVYFVIAAVPEHFTGNQTYNYSLDISRE